MGLRVLYLTDLASTFNEEAFRGMKLAGKLAGDGEILVRHWLTDSREEAIARNAGLAADATDRAEFEAFAPDVVFLEGGLYWNRDGDWRVPPDLAVSFVEKGGVFIVADVDRNEMAEHYSAYAGDLRFFGASLDGYPETGTQIRYVQDSASNDGHPSNVLCPWPKNDRDWPKEAYEGVDRVLAIAPVAVESRGQVVLWTATTGTVLSEDFFEDFFTDGGRTTPIATAGHHGLGYAVLVAAGVSPDVVTDMNPANITWLRNLATVLHERATLERRLRGASRPVASAATRSPYSERTAAELATLPESKFLEHKQTFSYNIHTKKKDPELSDAVMDRVCSFWNTEGGTLLVGVEDRTGRIVGISDDVKIFKDYDGLVKSVSDRLHQDVAVAAPSITVRTEEASGETLLRIDVPAGDAAVYRRDRFFVRVNNTTQELKGENIQLYVKRRWREQ
jgi:hypothetical protein